MSQSAALAPSVESLLAAARAAAHAGAAVLGAAQIGSHIADAKMEQFGNVVTATDLAAERAIRAVLADLRPDDLVSGEELDDQGEADARYRWSIDPLDGTSNFVKGLVYFGSSVAVQDRETGQWLAGSIVAPLIATEYWAARGLGAWTQRGEQAPRRMTGPNPASPTRLFGTGFSYDDDVRLAQYAALPELMRDFSDIRSIGSAALGLALAAEGVTDAFVESDLYEFDWAAGALIAEEAGLIVERPAGMRGGIRAYPPHLAPAGFTGTN